MDEDGIRGIFLMFATIIMLGAMTIFPALLSDDDSKDKMASVQETIEDIKLEPVNEETKAVETEKDTEDNLIINIQIDNIENLKNLNIGKIVDDYIDEGE